MIVTNYQQAKVRLDHDGIRISFGEVFFFTGLVLWLIQFYISRQNQLCIRELPRYSLQLQLFL